MQPDDQHNPPEVSLFFRLQPPTVGLAGLLLIPLLIDVEASSNKMFWIMIWGGCWGFIAGSFYTYMRKSLDVDGQILARRLWNLNKKNRK
ncbi:MAG: hypothetical protein PSY14_06815 [bacterium]|nr:hypothetical protein [bacterium]